jgi:hypothetical protein
VFEETVATALNSYPSIVKRNSFFSKFLDKGLFYLVTKRSRCWWASSEEGVSRRWFLGDGLLERGERAADEQGGAEVDATDGLGRG